MGNEREEELRQQNQALRDSISSLDADTSNLRGLQIGNAEAAEQTIKDFRLGLGEVHQGVFNDFDRAEEELNERFRKQGTFGSSAHIQAMNDFQAKKAFTLDQIRTGKLTSLQQQAVSSSERLQNTLSGSRSNADTILSSLQGSSGQQGFSRRMLDQFGTGVSGAIGRNIVDRTAGGFTAGGLTKTIGTVGSSIFGAGKSALGSLFGRKRATRSQFNKTFGISGSGNRRID